MEDLLSFLLYLLTFLGGFLVDKMRPNSKVRKVFILWLYIFLCFGYMTGSDWRSYENEYITGSVESWNYVAEPLSLITLTKLYHIIPDFWLFLGICKCIYLYAVLRLLKRLTAMYLSASSLLMNLSLVFMLISNPLRFMLALIPVMFALDILVQIIVKHNKLGKIELITICVLLIIGVLFHSASLFFLILFPILFYFRNITNYNRLALLISYIIVMFIISNIHLLNFLKEYINLYLVMKADVKEYSSYVVETNESLFLVGNLLKILFFAIVLITRDKMKFNSNLDKFLYSSTIIYFFIERIFLLIPTGFRLTIPLTALYAVYVITLVKKEKCKAYGMLIVLYMGLSFGKMVWESFDIIPYSNSIPYILTDHKSYNERDYYNINAYQERTGLKYE